MIEAIKLVEGGLAAMCDESWLVTCDAEVQRTRLVGRGTAPADATARIAAQGPFSEARAAVDRVIDTSGGVEETRAAVADAFDAAFATHVA